MRRATLLLIIACWTAAAPLCAQKCGSAMDYVVRARESIQPGLGTTRVEDILQLLKRASTLCPSMGEAWYYRHLAERELGRERQSAYALRKAREYGSDSLTQGVDPFAKASRETASAEPLVAIDSAVRQKWALVVGVGEFQDSRIPSLNFTSKDAADFAALLRSPSYGRFLPENVRLLVDEEATTQAIKASLNWLARNAAPEDLVVLYLSSHGSPRASDTAGVSYVVTHDTDISNPDQLYATALPMVDIADAMRSRVRAQRAVLFLDTCFSGEAVGGSRAVAFESGIGVSQETMSRIRQGRGRAIVTSSQPDERSWESEDLQNGYFTYYLIQALRQANGAVSVGDVYRSLKEQVSRTVRQEKGASQVPVLSASDQAENIVIGVGTPDSPQ